MSVSRLFGAEPLGNKATRLFPQIRVSMNADKGARLGSVVRQLCRCVMLLCPQRSATSLIRLDFELALP
jgi:hypothetical protein